MMLTYWTSYACRCSRVPNLALFRGSLHILNCNACLVYLKSCAQVLRGANLSIPRGTLHILAGANGCGKSTVLRILGRLLQRQSGDVSIDGPLGIVLQNPDHQIVMPTVAADVAFGLGRFGSTPVASRALWLVFILAIISWTFSWQFESDAAYGLGVILVAATASGRNGQRLGSRLTVSIH